MEIWKDINGYENKYQISNYGNVRSLNYKNKGVTHNMSPGSSGGYAVVGLTKNKVKKFYLVHRLVGEAFIPNENNLPEIDHIDRNKKNNNASNLRWVTKSENSFNRPDSCMLKPKKAIKVVNAETKKVMFYNSLNEAARDMNLSTGRISEACKGTGGNHSFHGYEWYYLNPINKSQTIIESAAIAESK